ncbi:MAG: DUF1351 domain-containing protein [Erysipelotrichaceae bacterium]|nr:DUF1351 domain-containing protein [Erysipelotrichaceae bacterium]
MNDLFSYAVEKSKAATLQQNIEQMLLEEKFNELQIMLSAELAKYDRVYTVEMTKEAKADRASLNKLSKQINDVKIRKKKEVMKQYEGFEAGCKALIALVEEASGKIDTQVKEAEEARRKARKMAIIQYYGANEEIVPLDMIFEPSWLNATVTDSNWQTAIDSKVQHIQGELNVIKSFGGEKAEFVRMEYMKNLNLFESIKSWEAFEARRAAIQQKPAEVPAFEEKVPEAEEKPLQEEETTLKLFDVSYTFIASERQLISIDAHLEALGIRAIKSKEEL